MPELDVNDPHRANAARRWNPAVRDRNYVYRGQDRDIYEDQEEGGDGDR